MKKLIVIAIILTASLAFAGGFLEKDASNQNTIQGFAPNGTLTQRLTVNSTTINMGNPSRAAYVVFARNTTCQVRAMASSTKGSNVADRVPATSWTPRYVNSASPFVNLSSCTGGALFIQ